MKVLIDTNVFIEREGNRVIKEPLQVLENQLKTNGHDILVHPLSKQEIRQHGDEDIRERDESKIQTYAELRFPNYPTSTNVNFRNKVGEPADFNEKVDNALLFAVYQGRVDLLITEDGGIHHKARQLGIDDDVLSIEEGRDRFEDDPPEASGPPSIQKVEVRDLDVKDPIFDSLKEEYQNFTEWFNSHQDRDAYVNWNTDGTIGAVLILKPNETEAIGAYPELPKRDRLKISTMKVASGKRGSKIGELLISISIEEAIHYGLEEIYLTHNIQEDDYLVRLIGNYGFEHVSDKEDGEAIFRKRLLPGPDDDPSPFETHMRFYPSFFDGPEVDKFLIPIQPDYHDDLFTKYEKRQSKLREFKGEFSSEGNAIKKAYLTNANIKQIAPSDILLFYRSKDHMEITTLGVCERVEYEVTDPARIQELVGRRSVFSGSELSEYAASAVTVILFKFHFHLENPLHYRVLRDDGILAGPLQSIQQVDEQDYKYIRDAGGIDERFVIN